MALMISVIMPVFNGARFLSEAVESILQQTESDLELIVVDDGSTDESPAIVRGYDDPRIVHALRPHQGEPFARNHGLGLARGDFIAYLDADDIALPSRLEVQRRQFFAPEIGYVHSDALLVDESSAPIGYWQAAALEPARLLRFFLKVGTPFNNPTLMFRREAIGTLRHPTHYSIGADLDLLHQLTLRWRGVHVPEPLVFYRRTQGSLSNSAGDYRAYFSHMQALLERHPIAELVPETGGLEEGDTLGAAIVGYFLLRRGLHIDGKSWYERAVAAAQHERTQRFVMALGHLVTSEPQRAVMSLDACSPADHLIDNYLGEAYAHLGDPGRAALHFRRALAARPDYQEPVTHLKALGALRNLHLLDRSWRTFLK